MVYSRCSHLAHLAVAPVFRILSHHQKAFPMLPRTLSFSSLGNGQDLSLWASLSTRPDVSSQQPLLPLFSRLGGLQYNAFLSMSDLLPSDLCIAKVLCSICVDDSVYKCSAKSILGLGRWLCHVLAGRAWESGYRFLALTKSQAAWCVPVISVAGSALQCYSLSQQPLPSWVLCKSSSGQECRLQCPSQRRV